MALMGLALAVRADTNYVDASVGSSGAGTSWLLAFKTIQEGVDNVTDGDTVLVTNGTYDARPGAPGLQFFQAGSLLCSICIKIPQLF